MITTFTFDRQLFHTELFTTNNPPESIMSLSTPPPPPPPPSIQCSKGIDSASKILYGTSFSPFANKTIRRKSNESVSVLGDHFKFLGIAITSSRDHSSVVFMLLPPRLLFRHTLNLQFRSLSTDKSRLSSSFMFYYRSSQANVSSFFVRRSSIRIAILSRF